MDSENAQQPRSLPSWSYFQGQGTHSSIPTAQNQLLDFQLAAMLSPLSLDAKPQFDLQLQESQLYQRRAHLQPSFQL